MKIFVLILLGLGNIWSQVTWIDGVVVTVNNEVILKSDLLELEEKIQKNDILNDIALGSMTIDDLKINKEKKIKYLIRTKILDAEVKRLKLEVTNDRLEQEFREIAKRNGIKREQLPELLKAQGMVFSDYKNYLKSRMEHQFLIDQEVASKLKISEEDLMTLYYNKYNKKPNPSFEVELYHIFFNPKRSGGSLQAKQRAEEVFSLISSEGNFFSLARKYSEDPDFQKDGFLGIFSKSDLELNIVKAIEKHKGLGLIPEIVKSRMGYHIFYVKSLKEIPDYDFMKKKEQLRVEAFEIQMRLAIDRWFDAKEKDFQIKVHRQYE